MDTGSVRAFAVVNSRRVVNRATPSRRSLSRSGFISMTRLLAYSICQSLWLGFARVATTFRVAVNGKCCSQG